MEITAKTEPNTQINNRKKVISSSIAGSAVGIAAGVLGVYAMAKKGNPSFSLKNLAYQEKDVLLISAGSILGGLTGGLLADKDKENVVPKLREASQQFVGSTLIPISLLALGNKLLEKTNFKLPKINSSSKPAQILNGVLSVLPKVAMTFITLFGGSHAGNKIVNKLNNTIFSEKVKHNVALEDMLVHTDDICLATSMLVKNTPAVATVTNTILPATFLISGAKVGIQQKEKC